MAKWQKLPLGLKALGITIPDGTLLQPDWPLLRFRKITLPQITAHAIKAGEQAACPDAHHP